MNHLLEGRNRRTAVLILINGSQFFGTGVVWIRKLETNCVSKSKQSKSLFSLSFTRHNIQSNPKTS